MDIYHCDMEQLSDEQRLKVLLDFRHEVEPNFVESLINQGMYQKVALVETKDLDKAFELTNHIDQDWTENKGVTPLKLMNRSSSVGDIFVLDNEAYIIKSLGFEKLPENTAQHLNNIASLAMNSNQETHPAKKNKM